MSSYAEIFRDRKERYRKQYAPIILVSDEWKWQYPQGEFYVSIRQLAR